MTMPPHTNYPSLRAIGWQRSLELWDVEAITVRLRYVMKYGWNRRSSQFREKHKEHYGEETARHMWSTGHDFPPRHPHQMAAVRARIAGIQERFPILRAMHGNEFVTYEDVLFCNLGLLSEPVETDMLQVCESKLGLTLPRDLRDFYQHTNGWIAHPDWRIVTLQELGWPQMVPRRAKGCKANRCLAIGQSLLPPKMMEYQFFLGLDVDNGKVSALVEQGPMEFDNFVDLMEWAYRVHLARELKDFLSSDREQFLREHEARIAALSRGEPVAGIGAEWKALARHRVSFAPATSPLHEVRSSAPVRSDASRQTWQHEEDPSGRRSAWLLTSAPGDVAVTASKIGGIPWLAPDEAWPTCEICAQPLQLFVQANLAELTDDAGLTLEDGLLQFFYCVSSNECDSFDSWQAYPSKMNRLVRVVRPYEHQSAPRKLPHFDWPIGIRHITRWKRVDDYPEDRQAAGSHHPDDKIGGWPSWVQSPEEPTCPICGDVMSLLLQLTSGQNVEWGWGDGGAAYIFRCPDHPDQLAMLWQCH